MEQNLPPVNPLLAQPQPRIGAQIPPMQRMPPPGSVPGQVRPPISPLAQPVPGPAPEGDQPPVMPRIFITFSLYRNGRITTN
jgi:hypothetical protein